MRTSRKNKHLLLHLLDYCDQVQDAVDRIGTFENLVSSSFCKNALSMPLVQIGELIGNLTDDLKEAHTHIPWVQIRALRNVLVHSYGKIEWERIWDTAVNDIPELKAKCVEIEQEIER